MESQLKIQGTQKFMGKEIPIVYGGFGNNQKVVLAKTVAEIHGEEVKVTNQRINMNRNRFKDGVDLIDLKVVNQIDHNLLKEFGFTQMQISKAKNIYLLSERGYAKLIKIMDSDLAWEIHDQLMDEYFTLRQEKEMEIQLSQSDRLALNILHSTDEIERVLAVKEFGDYKYKEGMVHGVVEISKEKAITIRYLGEVLNQTMREDFDKWGYYPNNAMVGSEFRKYLAHSGLYEIKKFRSRSNKNVYEKSIHFQPTQLFETEIVERGYGYTKRIDDERGKVEGYFYETIFNLIQDEEWQFNFMMFLVQKYHLTLDDTEHLNDK